MVHLTNQMAQKAPVPNIQDILKTNPDIARQLASAAMQQQSQGMRAQPQAPPPPPPSNPLAGLSSFMSSMMPPPPPPQQTQTRTIPTSIKSPVKLPKAQAPAPAPAPARELSPPVNIDDLLAQVNKGVTVNAPTTTTKRVSTTPTRKSTGKSTMSIKL